MDRRKILLVAAVLVAALGAALVFVYAQGAEDRAAEKLQSQQRLVATQIILPGESAVAAADANKLVSQEVPESQLLEGSTNDGNLFADTIALTTIYPGEQLVTQKFGSIEDIEGRPTLPIPEGKGAVTFELTEEQKVGSFAQPGSHVAVYITIPVSDDQLTDEQRALEQGGFVFATPACLFEDDLLVLGVGSTSVNAPPPVEGQESTAAQGEIVGTTLMTVAVDSKQAASLIGLRDAVAADGQERIGLRFVLRNDESRLRPTEACAATLEVFSQGLELVGSDQGADEETNG